MCTGYELRLIWLTWYDWTQSLKKFEWIFMVFDPFIEMLAIKSTAVSI